MKKALIAGLMMLAGIANSAEPQWVHTYSSQSSFPAFSVFVDVGNITTEGNFKYFQRAVVDVNEETIATFKVDCKRMIQTAMGNRVFNKLTRQTKEHSRNEMDQSWTLFDMRNSDDFKTFKLVC